MLTSLCVDSGLAFGKNGLKQFLARIGAPTPAHKLKELVIDAVGYQMKSEKLESVLITSSPLQSTAEES